MDTTADNETFDHGERRGEGLPRLQITRSALKAQASPEASPAGDLDDIHPLTGKPRQYADISEEDGIDWDEVVYTLENDPEGDVVVFDSGDYATEEEADAALSKMLEDDLNEVLRAIAAEKKTDSSGT